MSTRERQGAEAALTFHRRKWRVQRICWVALLALLGLALAGLFGNGPLSAVTKNGTSASIEYQRFVRHAGHTTLVVRPRTPQHGEAVTIALSGTYLEAFKLEHTVPEPQEVARDGEQVVFTFASRAASAPVVFYFEPDRLGAHTTQVVIAGETLPVRQFTYP